MFRSDQILLINMPIALKKSKRSKYNKSGVDYKKMIIIRNLDYIDDDNTAVIDKDEYIEFVQNLTRIQS